MPNQNRNPAPGFQKHPQHTITITPAAGVITVSKADDVIAQSNNALVLQEANYPPVFYLPIDDVIAPLTPTQTSTYCPFKGEASYWTITVPAGPLVDVMWGYLTPYDEMLAIKNHVAFYADKVDVSRTAS